MIINNQISIDQSIQQNQSQNKQLDNLNQQHQIQISRQIYTIKPLNFLHKFRIEILDQILLFLDLSSLLYFRLVSNSANELVLIYMPKKIELLFKQSYSLESQIQDMQKQELNQNVHLKEKEQHLKSAYESIYALTNLDLDQIRTFGCPPKIIEKVMTFVLIFLEPKFDPSCPSYQSWKQVQKLLYNFKIIQLILSHDIDSITERQATLLQEVHQIDEKQIQAISKGAALFFNFVKQVTLICELQGHRGERNIKIIHQKIKRLQQEINILQKFQK